MTKLRALYGALACGALSLAMGSSSHAAVTDFVIDAGSTQSKVDNACVGAIPGATGENCTYNAGTLFSSLPWIGPIYSSGYYANGNSPFDNDPMAVPLPAAPVPDPNKIELAITGSVQIDDVNGTTCDADDTIAGRFELAAGTRTFSGGPGTWAEESWGDNTVVYVLPASTPNFVNDLGAAGCEYIFGDKGFPQLLQTMGLSPAGVQTYPVDLEMGADPFDPVDGDQDVWAGPEPSGIGVGTFEGAPLPAADFDGNTGVTVSIDPAVFGAGTYQCVDNFGDPANPPVQGPAECTGAPAAGTPCDDAGSSFCGTRSTLENWIIRIVVDQSGATITSGQIFANNESIIFLVPPAPGANNSWDGPLITFTAGQANQPVANDDGYFFTAGATPAPQVQDIGANDENWAPNSAVVDDASGMLTGTGDQGGTFTITAAADIANVTASYTPAAGFTSGTETWVYRVTDAVSSDTDTATVTVTVTSADATPVANDLAGVTIDTQGISPSDASTDVDVGPGGDIPGNELGNPPSTVTATQGTAVSTAVNGTVITITASTFTSAGDTVDYTITDANGEMATGTISLTIQDVSPTVTSVTETLAFGGASTITVPFTPGNGAVADHTLTISQPKIGTVDNVMVDGAAGEITFDYTPNGFAGTDVLTIQLTDGDGSVDSGTATLTVTGAAVTNPPQDSLPGSNSSSAVSPVTLLALLVGMPLLRGRRRRL